MIEHEKKLLLSKEEYEVLLKHFGAICPTATQVNHYYDTNDWSMNKEGVTCRVRYRNGQFKATMKVHSKHPYGSSMEMDMSTGEGLHKNDFTNMGLSYQGALITRRTLLLKNDHCEMMVDMNQYLGHTDYELEIEYKKDHEYGAIALLLEVDNILREKCKSDTLEPVDERIKNPKTKSQRFFERKESLCFPQFTEYMNSENPPY